MPAGVYLLGSAAYQRQKRQAHAALGLCRMCTLKRLAGYTVCERHLAMVRASKAKKRRAA